MISDEIDTKIDYENSQFLRILEAISNSNIYKTYTPELSNQHKISHIQKVLLFSQIIYFIGKKDSYSKRISK